MKRPYLALVCALALLLAGAGCSDQPKVSPTPDTTVRPSETPVHSETPSAAMPEETDNYHAGGDGQVDLDGDGRTDGEHGVADDIRDAVDDAGQAAEDAAKDAGDLARDAVDGTGRAIEKAGDALTGR